jgi:hypothetical protein
MVMQIGCRHPGKTHFSRAVPGNPAIFERLPEWERFSSAGPDVNCVNSYLRES